MLASENHSENRLKKNILVVSRMDKVPCGIFRVIQGVFVFMFCFLIDQNIYSRLSQDCAELKLLLKSDEELLSLPCWKMSAGEIVGGTKCKKFPLKCLFCCTSSLQGDMCVISNCFQ